MKVINFDLEYSSIDYRIDLMKLKFFINKNIINCSFYTINYARLLNLLSCIVNGGKGTIELYLNTHPSSLLFIDFDKEFVCFRTDDIFNLYFENNSILRNSLRKFIDNFKIPSDEQINFLQNNIYYHGVYFPKEFENIPSKDQKRFLKNFGTYIENEITNDLCIEDYRNKFAIKHSHENIFIYNLIRSEEELNVLELKKKFFTHWKNLNLKLDEKTLKLLNILDRIYLWMNVDITLEINCELLIKIISRIRNEFIKFEDIPKTDFYVELKAIIYDYNWFINYEDNESYHILFELDLLKVINTSDDSSYEEE